MFGWFKKRKPDDAVDTDDLDDVAPAGYTREEWSGVALEMVSGLGLHTDASWIGGTVAACDKVLERILEKRRKYSDLEPAKLRHHVSGWLDYYERKARENRDDCETKKSKKRLDEYSEKSAIQREHQRDLREKLNSYQRPAS